jgi:tRNA pseudouridine55 synthase
MRPDNVIIDLNKPAGITSQQAVTKARKILGARKAGHAGTLDPLATGVLLVCLGEATKITRFLMDKDKEYLARMKLGERTDTLDAEGEVIETRVVTDLSVQEIEEAARVFTGRIVQKPPMYSAVKHRGRPLYALARKGLTVERATRPVDVHAITVTAVNLPFIDLTISCSKGTYIRSICDDLGALLGTLAHLTSLVRTRIGMFTIERAASLDELSSDMENFSAYPCIYTIDAALADFSEIYLNEDEYRKARNGAQIDALNLREPASQPFVRLKSPTGELFGIGRVDNDKISIERILNLSPQ